MNSNGVNGKVQQRQRENDYGNHLKRKNEEKEKNKERSQGKKSLNRE
jgi:hypothetical protein